MMKAIETVYNGYRFRSRLEARWAVFFDALNVKYQYELEGFELGTGWYLPDFFLPEEDSYIEIKPPPRPLLPGVRPHDWQDRQKYKSIYNAFELSQESGRKVYIFYGDPVEALAPGYPGMDGFRPPGNDKWLSFLYLYDYEPAAIRARQARFEFGETPIGNVAVS